MSIGIRTLTSKVKKLEQKTGVRDVNKYYNSLTYEKSKGLLLLWEAAVEANEMPSDEEAVKFLMDYLGCEEREAKYLWFTNKSIPRDPEIARLSEEQIDELLISTRAELEALEAERP